MAKVVKTERIYENKWFWVAAFTAVILISAIAGFYSAGGSVQGTIETVKHARKANNIANVGKRNYAEQARQHAIAQTFGEVLKLIQAGVIQRLDEARRQLYVNDPVWEVMSRDRKERVVRIVAEYLDWINDDHTGMVTAHSFRDGTVVARVNSVGTFTIFE